MKGLESAVEAPDSPLAPFDPRAKVSAALLTILTVSSFPAEPTPRFFAAGVYVLLLALVAAVGLRYLLKRCLAATPFIAMAALLPVLSGLPNGDVLACAVGIKAYAAILLLSALAATTPVDHTLRAVGALGAPRSLVLTTTLMYRYLFVLLDEWRRISRARECRTGGNPAKWRFRLWANQLAMVFVRGWERAERVTAAMILRGFNGSFPTLRRRRFSLSDWALAAGVPLGAVILRVS